MSLASTAALWTNDNNNNNQTRKRQPTIRRTMKIRPYNDQTEMDPDEYVTQSEAFQTIQNLKQSTPPTLDDLQESNGEKSAKVNELLNKITAFNAENDGNKLADFKPIEKPAITNNRAPLLDANGYSGKYLDPAELLPASLAKQRMGPFVANESPEMSYSNYNQTYSATPIFQKSANSSVTPVMDNKIIEKINYMIHLLEEQKSEKTANITEEFILYIFLGVFIIYTIDSFTKAGKYIR